MVVAELVPLNATVAALPPAPVMVPEILKVGTAAEVKLTAVASAPFTVTG